MAGAMDEVAAEDQETRTMIAFNLGEALEDPSPLFDLARAVEEALYASKGRDARDPSYRSSARRSRLVSDSGTEAEFSEEVSQASTRSTSAVMAPRGIETRVGRVEWI